MYKRGGKCAARVGPARQIVRPVNGTRGGGGGGGGGSRGGSDEPPLFDHLACTILAISMIGRLTCSLYGRAKAS